MTKQRLAGIISAIFDPLVEAPLLFTFLFLTKSRSPFWLLPVLIFVSAVLPGLFMFWGLRYRFITDWETSHRDQRHGFNLTWLLGSFLAFSIVYFFGDRFLTALVALFLLLLFFYTLITFYWKISGHMTANTSFFLILNLLFAWRFWGLVFLLPVVAWARWVRNKHDLWQLLGGFLLASLVVLCGFSLLF